MFNQKGAIMESNTLEQQVLKAQTKLSEIVEFIKDNANKLEAHEMEKELFREIQEMGKFLLGGYFSSVEKNDIGISLKNVEGVELKRHTKKSREYFSIFGNIDINRTVYWEKGYKTITPLDKQCNLPQSKFSYYVQDMLNSLSVNNPFTESKNHFRKFFNLTVHERQIQEMTGFVENEYEHYYLGKDIPEAETEGEIQVLSFDGKGVPMIKKEAAKIKGRQGKGEKRQKKKEALVGVSYTIDANERSAEEIATNLIYPEEKQTNKSPEEKNRALNIRRMASLKQEKSEVIDQILHDSLMRNKEEQRPTVVLIDGSLYLQKIVEKQLEQVKHTLILDIIHVTEYLWIAGNTLHGENTKESTGYVFKSLIKILEGKVGRVIGGLKQIKTKQKLKGNKAKSIDKVVTYFSNHQDLMKYDEYLSVGFPIGTGVVESACKQVVKQRMEGSGMRWGLERAESMLLLRSIKTSNDWDDFQEFNTKQQKQKLYGLYYTTNIAA
jgi:hypothetical protein